MVTIPAIRAKAQQRTCMPKEPCEKGSPYENRKSGGKTRYREEILCLNAKPWVPFSPLPLFPLFCAPQGSDSSPSSLPPRLLRVCACWRDWTHARLHLTFPILDILHHPHQGAFWRKRKKFWPKCDFNMSEIWIRLLFDFVKSQPTVSGSQTAFSSTYAERSFV